jgi:spiro-SPASM protein
MPQTKKILAFELNLFGDAKPLSFKPNLIRLYEKLDVSVCQDFTCDMQYLLKELYRASEGYDYVLFGHRDSQHYSYEDNLRLISETLTYDSDYGFAENYPQGVLLELIRREALPVMENIREESGYAVTRDIFQKIMLKDVNLFDLENLYAPVNLRTMRLSFFEDNAQDRYTLSVLNELCVEKKIEPNDFKNLAELILKNRDKLRTLPKYYEVEITDACSSACSFCPRTALGVKAEHFLSPADFKTIIDKAVALSQKPVIALTGMGDALSHPQFFEILNVALDASVEVVLETSGVELNQKLADKLISLTPEKSHWLTVIFSVEAVDEKLYQSLRKTDQDFSLILNQIEYFLLRRPKNTYVQAVKMTDNFEHLVAFHQHFEKMTSNLIIQKYNHYKNFLPERRLNAMTPLDPIDCWHLKRDIVIDVKGDVLVCKQDIKKEHRLGNIFQEDLKEIWKKGQVYMEKHLNGWDFCKGCDEFYTYNY